MTPVTGIGNVRKTIRACRQVGKDERGAIPFGIAGSFEETKKGSIEPGKVADLVVLSQDLLSVPDEKLLETEVLATIVNGKMLYESLSLTRKPKTP